ncbi:MAG: bis(5'-nucleosyl)-tetraphosphatase (symmetrical) YqeK [Candidatus Gastranaerophilales bacterium]|nr:bis(5'-nucleosyl)-tetraphosphatase (symmetrical) YqeK [Candidatus Gastranaerophilales bacterium]
MTYINQSNVLDWLRENLNEERYEHSIGVSETAVELAEMFNLDKEKAYVAGLLHDCAKCLSNDELMNIIKEHINVQECEMINPKMFHAPVGAYLANTQFNISDEEILSAIRWHTIGKLNMTDFEKIIFIADKIEQRTRPTDMINAIRPHLYKENGLNLALLECYKLTIKSLVDRDLKICISTIEIYNELLNG